MPAHFPPIPPISPHTRVAYRRRYRLSSGIFERVRSADFVNDETQIVFNFVFSFVWCARAGQIEHAVRVCKAISATFLQSVYTHLPPV